VQETVTLALVITGGVMLAQKEEAPPKGITPPNAHAHSQKADTGLWHIKDKQGCKVQLDRWAKGPKDVSFKLIECREGKSDPAEGDGLFAGEDGKIHPVQGWWGLEALVADKGYKWKTGDISGYGNPGAFADGNYKQNIYMMYRKALAPAVANADDGHKYAESLSKMKAEKTNGVATVWKDPVGPFTLAAARGSNTEYKLPQPE
jgi:hypothetical protein